MGCFYRNRPAGTCQRSTLHSFVRGARLAPVFLFSCTVALSGCIPPLPIGGTSTVGAKPGQIKVGKTTRAQVLNYRYFQFPNATTPDGRFLFYRYHKETYWVTGLLFPPIGGTVGSSYHGYGVFLMEYDRRDVVKNVVVQKCDADTPSICSLDGETAMWKLIGELLGEREAARYRSSLVPVTLHQAVLAGNTEEVKRLLDKGVPANTRDDNDRTALMIATDEGNQALVRLLIAYGADVRVRSAQGDTPLIHAAEGNNSALVALLLANGAEVNAANNFGDTALMLATKHGRAEAVSLLLAKGAAVDAKDNGGWTALHWAAFEGHAVVVKLLLTGGANVSAKTNQGRTPLQVAAQRGHEKIVDLLRQDGAKE